MSTATGLSTEDLPNSPHARQLRAGFPWLTFDGELEAEFRRRNFDENLLHSRVNLCLAILIAIAFSAMDAMVLGPQLDRIPSRLQIIVIIPILAIAGSFAAKKTVPPSYGAFPTDTGLFVALLIGTVVIIGGLTFFPALALGPIVEHYALRAGDRF